MLELNNMQQQSTCVSLTVLFCFVSSYIKSVNVFPVKDVNTTKKYQSHAVAALARRSGVRERLESNFDMNGKV